MTNRLLYPATTTVSSSGRVIRVRLVNSIVFEVVTLAAVGSI